MHTVTSFHASAVDPHRIGAILADYFELERLRAYRRRFVARFSALALVLPPRAGRLSSLARKKVIKSS